MANLIPEDNMTFKDDFDMWQEYAKSVKKLDKSNISASKNLSHKKYIKTNPEKNELIQFMTNRNSFNHINVENLNKSNQKKFKAKATLDLHGYTRNIDHTLEVFCSKCILNDCREVIIITGKGEGIVKEATRFWLTKHPEFVIGFFEIKDSLGESGAFGIRLRSK